MSEEHSKEKREHLEEQDEHGGNLLVVRGPSFVVGDSLWGGHQGLWGGLLAAGGEGCRGAEAAEEDFRTTMADGQDAQQVVSVWFQIVDGELGVRTLVNLERALFEMVYVPTK